MRLSPEDVDLFYKLIWPLRLYVNQQLQILPDIQAVEDFFERPPEEWKPVRDAVYDNPQLIDAFVTENPMGFSEEELTIVRNWKHYVAGDFFIERILKKGAYFIQTGNEPKVYEVLAIQDTFQEIFYWAKPPIMVKTVLLPFKGRIIYDGLISAYPIYFGSGIKSELKEIYLAAKQQGRIIVSLEPGVAKFSGPKKPSKDWRPDVAAIVKASNKLKGEDVPIQSEAFSLLKASARLAQAAVESPDDLEALRKKLRRVQSAARKLEDALMRAEM